MTRRLWIADEAAADRAWLTGEHARHLANVLRAEVGQEFDVVSDGRTRRGKITEVTTERVTFELGDDVAVAPLPTVHLVMAVYKFDRMEWAIEKCVELGVASIQPFIASRTDSHLAKSAENRVERWRRLARQAAEQSRRPLATELKVPVRLRDIEAYAALRIVLAENERERSLADALSEARATSEAGSVHLAIGPEGGWADGELQWLAEAGWTSASLGPTILRAETAAIAATAITFSLLTR